MPHPFRHPNVTRISGPPGTGKTTYLLALVDDLLKSGVLPEKIAFLSFTKAATEVAKSRAMEKFRLPDQRLPWFRTMHSMCYRTIPGKPQILSNRDMYDFARLMGLYFSLGKAETGVRGTGKGDQLLALSSLSKVSRTPLKLTYDNHRKRSMKGSFSWQELEHFDRSYTEFKANRKLIDFNDLLDLWLSQGSVPPVSHVILDEAQDSSALQWSVLNLLCAKATMVWIAGDDDQAIHAWSGADAELFIELGCRDLVLGQSYRIPDRVHREATAISARLSKRLPKDYNPRNEPGSVLRLNSLDHLPLDKGTWLLLARNLCFLDSFSELCARRGFPALRLDGDQMANRAFQAVSAWNQYRTSGRILAGRAKIFYDYMSSRDRVAYGGKAILDKIQDDIMLEKSQLEGEFGLLARGTWQQALDRISPETATLLEAAEKKGENFTSPRIRISTIHGAKGDEADNVAVLPDMTQRTYDSMIQNPDWEHRVFYVAVTRAKNALYLLNPTTDKAYRL